MTDLEYRRYKMSHNPSKRGTPVDRLTVMKQRRAKATVEQLEFVRQFLDETTEVSSREYEEAVVAYNTKACEWHLFSEDDDECEVKFKDLTQAVRECDEAGV